ncbi:dnaJ homolog subfamily C member 24 isoform X2 [Takifugu flavidus]|uniref:DnaJ-like protein subfamily C member 24 n=1 Tax=Takifugu flavidus TaxID=433684 RepID=A0A5C6P9Q5_9TELE|nr:dnaJ homolog subfamily C member 24 isoform X2 [Takifugu flavidus]TWW76213.1 hypothetical protein D4764_13G0008750 [Takifugu flavidus]
MGETEHTDLYRVLGATSGDSVQHIKHKYQQLALQYHPDRFRGDTPEEADAALKKFLEIDAAWRILKDQASRRQYDLKLRAQELTQDWPVDRTVGLEDMSWDEDNGAFAHSCRCGGAFSMSEEEMKMAHEEEEEEAEGGGQGGMVVCCDTCSLSVFVTTQKKPPVS